MNFYNYMTRNFIDEDGPRGDLAKDMKMDKATFPKNGVGKFDGWYKIIRDYLLHQGACYECMETFEACWKEYELLERKRLRLPLKLARGDGR